MKTGILGFIGSKNIGDYVQTKAVIDLVGSKNIKILDRENLDKYNDNVIQTIINGWFMESPENWPPSKKIKPLFISFHLNPSIKTEFLKDESIKYFKSHEPVGSFPLSLSFRRDPSLMCVPVSACFVRRSVAPPRR